MSIRTVDDLQIKLDEFMSWRIHEISNFTTEVQKAENITEKALIRAGIPLIYAHWEGFVKESTISYIEFVESQRKTLNELSISFIALGVRKYVHDLVQSKNDEVNINTLKIILDKLDSRAILSFDASIQTESNLSSKVFRRILSTIGIDYMRYSTKEKLLDEKLLNTRNKIAHGEYKNITIAEYDEIKDEILIIMRTFKNDIENNASQKKYLREIA